MRFPGTCCPKPGPHGGTDARLGFGSWHRRQFLQVVGQAAALFGVAGGLPACRTARGQPPNFVIIFTDDQGYNDLGIYGSPNIRTPRIDRMAAEGMRFTDFYVSPICSPSRAALLTGSYPVRVGVPDVHLYDAPFGLSPDEITIADMLKPLGYSTACIGKWHLGQDDKFAPNRQGFDYFYGIRIVNGTQPFENFAVPLYYNDRKITERPNHFRFTEDFTREAIQFIERSQHQPFLLYLAHPMPHIPIYPGKEFQGVSDAGLYGDAVEEIDWCTGLILDHLLSLGLDEHTLVIYTSDNGPWLGFGDQSGSAEPLRGGKLTTWEGGVRVPCIMRWPNNIPAGTICSELVTIMDIMPTIADLSGASLPHNGAIDGKSLWPLMQASAEAKSPHEVYYYYAGTWLQALRAGEWKLHLARPESREGIYGECAPWLAVNTTIMEQPELYNLHEDPGETRNVAAQYPDIVVRLSALADEARAELGDYGQPGRGVRPTGSAHPDYPVPHEWLGSPHWEATSSAMQEDMRAFRKYRFQLLSREDTLDAREKLEWQWYVDHPDQVFE